MTLTIEFDLDNIKMNQRKYRPEIILFESYRPRTEKDNKLRYVDHRAFGIKHSRIDLISFQIVDKNHEFN